MDKWRIIGAHSTIFNLFWNSYILLMVSWITKKLNTIFHSVYFWRYISLFKCQSSVRFDIQWTIFALCSKFIQLPSGLKSTLVCKAQHTEIAVVT